MASCTRNLIFIGIALWANPIIESFAETGTPNPYAIPHNKMAEEPCKKAALEARPGEILSSSIHNRSNGLHYEYEIEHRSEKWIVICDGVTREIIRNELIE